MKDQQLEQIITAGIKIGTIATLKSLGLLPEVVTKRGGTDVQRTSDSKLEIERLDNLLPYRKHPKR